ncbi:MAG: hypothetical protein BWY76_01066 [bacterium ADurb.Bin429]|nr:MAG: hypothetical protein BWY76_01066 [bacterium ADurb.Bin429]
MLRTPQARLQAALYAVAAHGVVLQFAGDQRHVGKLAGHRGEEARGGGELQPQAGKRLPMVAQPLNHARRRTAAVVAHAVEGHGVGDAVGQVTGRIAQMPFVHVAPGAVAAGDAEHQHLRAVIEPPPAEEARRQRHLVLLRAHHHVVALPRRAHNARQGGGVAKTVHVVRHLWKHAEAVEEVALSQFDLPLEGEAAGKIAVRLNPPAAHQRPASAGDMRLDALQQRRVGLFDLPVAPRFAGGEDGLRIVIQQVAHRAAGIQHLVQPRLPWPQPDGVEVRVADQVHGDGRRHAHGYSRFFGGFLQVKPIVHIPGGRDSVEPRA